MIYCTVCDEMRRHKTHADGSWWCRSCGHPIECTECGGTLSANHDCAHAIGRDTL